MTTGYQTQTFLPAIYCFSPRTLLQTLNFSVFLLKIFQKLLLQLVPDPITPAIRTVIPAGDIQGPPRLQGETNEVKIAVTRSLFAGPPAPPL